MAEVFESHHFVNERCTDSAVGLSPVPGVHEIEGLSEKIGETKYRVAYRSGSYAVKKTKPFVPKRYFGLSFGIPTSLYTTLKFAIRDLSVFEYEQYLKVIAMTPPRLHEHFARVFSPLAVNGETFAINELVMNDDGSVSKMLRSFGPCNDQQFWQDMDRLEHFFLQAKIYYFGMGCNNVCVREQADGRLVPVLIDYKRIGARTFWQQFWLFLPFVKKLKLKRRFSKIRKRYRID
mgnify:CR=1 FL=1